MDAKLALVQSIDDIKDKITLQEEISVIGYMCDLEEGTKIITKGNNVFDINAQGWNAFSK